MLSRLLILLLQLFLWRNLQRCPQRTSLFSGQLYPVVFCLSDFLLRSDSFLATARGKTTEVLILHASFFDATKNKVDGLQLFSQLSSRGKPRFRHLHHDTIHANQPLWRQYHTAFLDHYRLGTGSIRIF